MKKAAELQKKMLAMNEALILGSVRQHELTETAEDSNALLQTEMVVRRRSEALFTALIEQSPVGVYVVDAQFCLQQVNPTARFVFKNVQPLIGRDFSEVIHVIWPRQVADQIVKLFRRTLQTGAPYQSPDFAQRRRDLGVKEIYEWQIQRVTLPAGEHGVVCFFNNITQRKQAEAALRRLSVMAATNQKLKNQIQRREVVEKALRKSRLHQDKLLAQSRQMHIQLRSLSHQILMAQEEERKKISRELHDEIAQSLAGINVHLATLKKKAARTTPGLNRHINHTQRLVEKSVKSVHEFARELRPTVLDDLGLIPALQTFVKTFSRRFRLRVAMNLSRAVEKLDGHQRTVLYRVAQEALTNIARHAQARRVKIVIQKHARHLGMKIQDDGKSFEVERVWQATGKHLGLLGMRERVEMIGGEFCVKSAPGEGTTVHVDIPVHEPKHPAKKSGAQTPLECS